MKGAAPVHISEAEGVVVRWLEEAPLGDNSHLPGAVPASGYRIRTGLAGESPAVLLLPERPVTSTVAGDVSAERWS